MSFIAKLSSCLLNNFGGLWGEHMGQICFYFYFWTSQFFRRKMRALGHHTPCGEHALSCIGLATKAQHGVEVLWQRDWCQWHPRPPGQSALVYSWESSVFYTLICKHDYTQHLSWEWNKLCQYSSRSDYVLELEPLKPF